MSQVNQCMHIQWFRVTSMRVSRVIRQPVYVNQCMHIEWGQWVKSISVCTYSDSESRHIESLEGGIRVTSSESHHRECIESRLESSECVTSHINQSQVNESSDSVYKYVTWLISVTHHRDRIESRLESSECVKSHISQSRVNESSHISIKVCPWVTSISVSYVTWRIRVTP